ncbi:alpha/beta hydrolase [Micromonospora sp. M12]
MRRSAPSRRRTGGSSRWRPRARRTGLRSSCCTAPGQPQRSAPRGIVVYRLGVHLVCYDRPGYGDSDRHEGRRVADAAADVKAIADDLGIERFAVVGRSGGGPHALACAALLPDRVTRAAVLVGLARRAHPTWTGTPEWPRRTWRTTGRPTRIWPSSRST